MAAAGHLDLPILSADGSSRVSGHSLRVTGAQGLARAGVDTWAIQLLGRWGSAAVLGYIQEVPLTNSSTWAHRAARGWSLAEAVEAGKAEASKGHIELAFANSAPVFAGDISLLKESLAHEVTVGTAIHSDLDMFIASAGSRGHWHRVPPVGRVGPMPSWATICGWKFANSSMTLVDSLPDTALHRLICSRCLPDAHAAARTLALAGL